VSDSLRTSLGIDRVYRHAIFEDFEIRDDYSLAHLEGRVDCMEGFAKMDQAFHEDLRGLVKAAKDDDLEEATTRYRDLVQGCTDCHTKYRFEGRQ
jgi:hypothetical protein